MYNHSSSSHSYDHNSRHKILLITDTRLHKVALYTQLMQERHRPKSSDHKGCGVKTWTTLDGFVAEHLEEVRGQVSETHIVDNLLFSSSVEFAAGVSERVYVREMLEIYKPGSDFYDTGMRSVRTHC